MHHPTDRITHTMAFVTLVVEHWLNSNVTLWLTVVNSWTEAGWSAVPERQESSHNAVGEGRPVPGHVGYLPRNILRSARSIKWIGPVLTKNSTNHSQWVANWKNILKYLNNRTLLKCCSKYKSIQTHYVRVTSCSNSPKIEFKNYLL